MLRPQANLDEFLSTYWKNRKQVYRRLRAIPYAGIIAGAVLAMVAVATTPVHATDDVAEAERMLQINRLAKELVSRATERARDAAMESSAGDEWRAIDCSRHWEAAEEARKEVFARYNIPTDEDGRVDFLFFESEQWKHRFERHTTKRALEALSIQNRVYREAREAAQPHDDLGSSCFDDKQRKFKEIERLYYQLRPKFIADELEKYIEQIVTDAERALVRSAVDRLAI